MTIHRISIRTSNLQPDSSVFQAPISTQLSLTNPAIGRVMAYVLFDDGAADLGWSDSFMVPTIYVGSPKIIVSGVFDGEPGAGDDLGFTMTAKELADDEGADAAFGTEDVYANTDIGAYADKDYFEVEFSLSNIVPVANETIFYHFGIDFGSTTFSGNILSTGLHFEFSDA